ncbi:hypothetical protein C8Q76DRAFT_794571 [Earliella scabrosa]|nr:hypothetical protein C8Q76DRAFT_794571 [Earliella scabrosa]
MATRRCRNAALDGEDDVQKPRTPHVLAEPSPAVIVPEAHRDANPGYDARTSTASKPACEEPAAHLRREDDSPNLTFGLDRRVLHFSHYVPASVPMSDPFQRRCSELRAADTRERTSVFLARARRALLSRANINTLERADEAPKHAVSVAPSRLRHLLGSRRTDGRTDNRNANAELGCQAEEGKRRTEALALAHILVLLSAVDPSAENNIETLI